MARTAVEQIMAVYKFITEINIIYFDLHTGPRLRFNLTIIDRKIPEMQVQLKKG